jgi:hypothetical protein
MNQDLYAHMNNKRKMKKKKKEPLACNINASLTRAAVLLPFT